MRTFVKFVVSNKLNRLYMDVCTIRNVSIVEAAATPVSVKNSLNTHQCLGVPACTKCKSLLCLAVKRVRIEIAETFFSRSFKLLSGIHLSFK